MVLWSLPTRPRHALDLIEVAGELLPGTDLLSALQQRNSLPVPRLRDEELGPPDLRVRLEGRQAFRPLEVERRAVRVLPTREHARQQQERLPVQRVGGDDLLQRADRRISVAVRQ